MFWCKRSFECKLLEPKQVKCETCKHWIDKEDAQKVKTGGWRNIFYCPMHNVLYGEMEEKYENEISEHGYCTSTLITRKYYKIIPEQRVECDKNGKIIKKKKNVKR